MSSQRDAKTIKELRGMRNAFRAILGVVVAVDIACVITLIYFAMNGKDISSLMLVGAPLLITSAASAPLLVRLSTVNRQLSTRENEVSNDVDSRDKSA